jgi:hypothetical protein
MGNQQMVVVVALDGGRWPRETKSAPPRLLGINIESKESKESSHRNEKLVDDEHTFDAIDHYRN